MAMDFRGCRAGIAMSRAAAKCRASETIAGRNCCEKWRPLERRWKGRPIGWRPGVRNADNARRSDCWHGSLPEWSTAHATWYKRSAVMGNLGVGCGIRLQRGAERCFADAAQRMRARLFGFRVSAPWRGVKAGRLSNAPATRSFRKRAAIRV